MTATPKPMTVTARITRADAAHLITQIARAMARDEDILVWVNIDGGDVRPEITGPLTPQLSMSVDHANPVSAPMDMRRIYEI